MCIVTSSKIDIPRVKHNNQAYGIYSTSCHQEISVQRIMSDASTILLMYFPPYLSSRILNLPLPLCTIFASNSASSTNRKHQQEYFFSLFDIVVDDNGIKPKSYVTLKEPSLTYELVP